MGQDLYDVCIAGGLGHVGLPLGISLAEAGKKVVIFDVNPEVAALVRQGKMPFLERNAQPVLGRVLNKTLFISLDKQAVAQSRFVVVVIGTPVDEHLNPNFTLFKRFFDGILDCLRDDQHLVLRSTVKPGTTEKIKDYLLRKGLRTKVSFCPERISQGYAMEELKSLPQIVSSCDESGSKEVAGLFSCLTEDIVFLSPLEAELAKLFTNTWRYIQFAISNQMFQIATQHGLDFYRIYNALTHNYPRARDFPKAGFAAGPCLFKDTMQLSAFSNNSFFLGHAAMLVNEGMPNHLISLLKEKHPLKYQTVGILGMAFKANNDDKRESLSYKLKKLLEMEAKEVLCSDVYIEEDGFVSAEDLVRRCDVIILGAPHAEYAHVAIPPDKILVDIWNFHGQGSPP